MQKLFFIFAGVGLRYDIILTKVDLQAIILIRKEEF